jgi:hypothetical protein
MPKKKGGASSSSSSSSAADKKKDDKKKDKKKEDANKTAAAAVPLDPRARALAREARREPKGHRQRGAGLCQTYSFLKPAMPSSPASLPHATDTF